MCCPGFMSGQRDLEVHTMKRPNRISAAFGAIILAAVALIGAFSASASAGEQTDPLITLSYLTRVIKPELLSKVDEQVAANEQALLDKVNDAIEEYSKEMEENLGGTVGDGAAYTAVILSKDELLCPDAGVEILVRTGSAKVLAGSVPVVHDATSGAGVGIGGALQANHLYVVPLEGAVISALTDCTLLVRGTFVVV